MEYLFGTKKNVMDSISSNQKDKLSLLINTNKNIVESKEQSKELISPIKEKQKTIVDLMKENKKIIIKPKEGSIWTIENFILTIEGNGIIQSYIFLQGVQASFILFYMTTGHTFKVKYNTQKDIMVVDDGTHTSSFNYELCGD